MKSVVPVATAISVGLVVLASYFVDLGELTALRLVLTDWAATLGGLAVLIGIGNLLLVHLRRVNQGVKGWPYSTLTLAFTLAMIIGGVLEASLRGPEALYARTSYTGLLFDGVIVASQAALASLVMFALVFAAVRMLHVRPVGWTVLFLVSAAVVLVGWIPLAGVTLFAALRTWLLGVPVVAGARGVALGVALGVVMVGLRVLTGLERPYRG
ncbi:MAG: hypothetical protein IT326_03530 [Anaerolineae bacterium]|nr:hypothetical protein [Anaerolineae bacterium]